MLKAFCFGFAFSFVSLHISFLELAGPLRVLVLTNTKNIILPLDCDHILFFHIPALNLIWWLKELIHSSHGCSRCTWCMPSTVLSIQWRTNGHSPCHGNFQPLVEYTIAGVEEKIVENNGFPLLSSTGASACGRMAALMKLSSDIGSSFFLSLIHKISLFWIEEPVKMHLGIWKLGIKVRGNQKLQRVWRWLSLTLLIV